MFIFLPDKTSTAINELLGHLTADILYDVFKGAPKNMFFHKYVYLPIKNFVSVKFPKI